MTNQVTPADQTAAALALDTRTDARNRALRSALQLLAVSIIVDVIPMLLAVLDTADAGEPIDWPELGRAVIRIALIAVLALLTRYWAPPPAPESPTPTVRRRIYQLVANRRN